jgi:hypothetical protein
MPIWCYTSLHHQFDTGQSGRKMTENTMMNQRTLMFRALTQRGFRVLSHKGFRISDRLAIVAALLLLASSAADGLQRHYRADQPASVAAQKVENPAGGNSLTALKSAVISAKGSAKGFKLSLFLYPRG